MRRQLPRGRRGAPRPSPRDRGRRRRGAGRSRPTSPTPTAADALFAGAEASSGPVLVLVNNAGMRADGLVAAARRRATGRRVLDTNLTGRLPLTRRALRPMLRARFGRIVNVASIVGPRANPGQANYAASKAGLIGLTKTVAAEVARRGVTVNAVAPGLIETDTDRRVLDGRLRRARSRPAAPAPPRRSPPASRFLASDGGRLRDRHRR